jgi:integrase
MYSYLHLCGLDVDFSPEGAKQAGYIFLRAIVSALDHQCDRNRGIVVRAESVAPPLTLTETVVSISGAPVAAGPSWDEVFEAWRNFVPNRPKATTIASQTAWRDLGQFATTRQLPGPSHVTPVLMSDFVDVMHNRGLSVDTVNSRLTKIKAVYKIAVGRHKLAVNPAQNTLGKGKSGVERRRISRLPFDEHDLAKIFGSDIFTKHWGSRGQSGEVTYWILVLMYYTGARPEEIAGLALSEIKQHPKLGWYFDVKDRPEPGDAELFPEAVPNSERHAGSAGVAGLALDGIAEYPEQDLDFDVNEVPESEGAPLSASLKPAPGRTVKNIASVRQIPMAPELVDLGLFRYLEWVRAQGHDALFPTLTRDWHGKVSGSFSKFFGRYKQLIGISNPKKVLYSFRHSMKDFLEHAEVPPKALKRILGHTSGDGKITDGYGSGVPLSILTKYSRQLKFTPILARPWEPGQGHVALKQLKQ